MFKSFLLLLFGCLITVGDALAQLPPSSFDPVIDTLPIDQGVAFTLIAGAAYGYKKLRNRFK